MKEAMREKMVVTSSLSCLCFFGLDLLVEALRELMLLLLKALLRAKFGEQWRLALEGGIIVKGGGERVTASGREEGSDKEKKERKKEKTKLIYVLLLVESIFHVGLESPNPYAKPKSNTL